MGLTIHYSGNFRRDQSLPGMISEAVEFAKNHDWRFFLFDTDFPSEETQDGTEKETRVEPDNAPHYGVMLMPPECEPVHLYFDIERRLGFESDLRQVTIESWVQEDDENGHWEREELPADYEPTWGAFTKTQWAGADVHLKVVQILKQLSEKYFSDFVVNDESDFWDHGDEKLLRERFGKGVMSE